MVEELPIKKEGTIFYKLVYISFYEVEGAAIAWKENEYV